MWGTIKINYLVDLVHFHMYLWIPNLRFIDLCDRGTSRRNKLRLTKLCLVVFNLDRLCVSIKKRVARVPIVGMLSTRQLAKVNNR